MNHRRILSQIALIIGTLLFSLGVQTYAQTWTAPASAPPNSNAYAPLTTGPSVDIKRGGLLINTGNALNGLIVQNGNVGIGTVSPSQKLTVNGIIQSMSGGIKFPDGTVQATASRGAGAETDPTVKSWAKTDNPTIPGNLQVNGTITQGGGISIYQCPANCDGAPMEGSTCISQLGTKSSCYDRCSGTVSCVFLGKLTQ